MADTSSSPQTFLPPFQRPDLEPDPAPVPTTPVPSEGRPVWADPPPKHSIPGAWVELLTPVMERPGEWAWVKRFDSKKGAERTMGSLNKGRTKVPDGIWEFTSRSNPESNTSDLWARYMGPSDGTALKLPTGPRSALPAPEIPDQPTVVPAAPVKPVKPVLMTPAESLGLEDDTDSSEEWEPVPDYVIEHEKDPF